MDYFFIVCGVKLDSYPYNINLNHVLFISSSLLIVGSWVIVADRSDLSCKSRFTAQFLQSNKTDLWES